MPENKCTEPCADLTRLERQVKVLQKQNGQDHREMRDRLTELEKEEAVRTEQYKTILGKLDKLLKWQEDQQSKPGKRWESIVEKAIWAVAAAVIAFLLARVGL